ncbi:hypothetical protein EVAR_25683_1 [Eumeta japonica]|uniref:Uncharacterized protein n=1 Tax=Eumeta variegata TaxID=151549 RepID=A0A4C1WGF7_EUMVA|nr:hypothetical protein EVAR_25683_1 [Eumeta japonica]
MCAVYRQRSFENIKGHYKGVPDACSRVFIAERGRRSSAHQSARRACARCRRSQMLQRYRCDTNVKPKLDSVSKMYNKRFPRLTGFGIINTAAHCTSDPSRHSGQREYPSPPASRPQNNKTVELPFPVFHVAFRN